MAFGSFFTRALDVITPWNRGGETLRTQQRKKREEEEAHRRVQSFSNNRVAPSQNDNVQNQLPEPPKPVNIFETLNKNLVFNKPQNAVSVEIPNPEGIIKPKQSLWDKVRDQVDANTEADKYRRRSSVPTSNTIQSHASVAARSAGSVGSNLAGGLIGVGKGIVELPSFALRASQLARLGAAKVTGNKQAEENIGNDRGNLAKLAERYENFVKPVTGKLARAELATDREAERLAPWSPSYIKPSVKVLSNVIPIEAALAGIIGLSKARNARRVVKEGEAAAGTAGAAGSTSRVVNIPVKKDIPVDEVIGSESLDVPVQTTPKPTIREFPGDAPTTSQSAVNARQPEPIVETPTTRPDQRIEGVTPQSRFLGEARGVTRVELDTERAMLDEALANKEINKTQHKAANKALDETVPTDAPPPKGEPITVKQVDGIDVRDETVIPQNLPETPGQVRATKATAPSNAKSEAVAAQLPPIPKAGTVMPDGKVVTKRMVQAARNQRKNAKAMVKAQEQAAEDLAKINAKNAPNTALDSRQPGLILSDETKKGKKGAYQVAHQADQTNELGTKSVGQIIEEADTSIKNNGSLTDRDIANVKAALDSGIDKAGTPEYKKLSDLYWKDGGTHDAQRLALRNQSLHRTGSATEISNRAVSKLVALADDPTKITDKQIADIIKTSDDYVNLRDARLKASDDFNANPTKENYNRFVDLDKQASRAEKSMAMSQYTAAKSSLKGNTNVKLRRLIEDAAEDADLYTMDFVDSALLSNTGTFTRNFVNATLGSVEEGLFGGIGARVGRTVKGTPVGGGVGRGSMSGFGKGAGNIVDASKARFKNAGKNPIEHMKNWSTTGNQLGDSMIGGSVGRSVRNHYEQMLKKQGYSGDELRMRADVMARTDPDDLARDLYAPQARKDAGLGSGISKRSSFEKDVQRKIGDAIAKTMGKEFSQGGENFAKGVTRIVLGFPSAIGRSLIAGSQRIIPFANIDTVKAFTAPNATARAAAVKESIKKSGTAATAATIFGLMGANDMITGAYPKDQNERDRWEREGIKENSIKIGDAWYDAPSYLGSFGLPVLVWASIGRNGGINSESLKDIRAIVGATSPTKNISDINDMLDGKTDFGKYTQSVAASAARMATPYGSLLNQLSKVFDETQNDTTGDNWAEGLFNRLIEGIPFADSGLPDKTDKEGNPLYNPSVAETMFGAAGAVQKSGEERSRQINQETNDALSKIDKYGLLNDPNMDGVLEGTALEAFNKAKTGEQLDESEIKALKEGLVKGVRQEGTDTAYLERGQYDTNLAVLQLKRDLMNSDPTVKPSSLKDVDVAIKRGKIYKEDGIPYEFISAYKDTSLTEWRNMGDPDHEDYDADMYQKLWDIDQAMTKAGVSYRKGTLDKQKYFAKEKKGRGAGSRGGVRQLDTSFGTLKDGTFAPRVQQYSSIDAKSGTIPFIRTVRPNIVHKITSSG